jgi:hypothetical protein
MILPVAMQGVNLALIRREGQTIFENSLLGKYFGFRQEVTG